MSDQLAFALATTLVEQDLNEGLSDDQVAKFLSLLDSKVPNDVQGDPTKLSRLLECSKNIARHIDEYDMPRITVTVQDFKFAPPSIQSDLPCHVQFKLLPYSGEQQISVINSSTGAVVATSNSLKPGDSFNTTIVEPGTYAFSSDVYSFMSGCLVATDCNQVDANNRPECDNPSDCVKTSTDGQQSAQPHTTVPHAANVVGHKPCPLKVQIAGNFSGQRRGQHANGSLQANSAAQTGTNTHLQQQQHARTTAAAHATDGSDAGKLDVNPAAHATPGFAPSTATSCHGQSERRRHSSCGSDTWEVLPQQPSEQAVLELVAAGTQPQRLQHATAVLERKHKTPADYMPAAELSRSGRWARRATLYDDSHDPCPMNQTAPASLQPLPHQTSADREQQGLSVHSTGVRFAKGLEGLVFRPGSTPSQTPSSVEVAGCEFPVVTSVGGTDGATYTSAVHGMDLDPFDAADAATESDAASGSCSEVWTKGDWYERLPSHSSEHSSVSDDLDSDGIDSPSKDHTLPMQQPCQCFSPEDILSEEAQLLSSQKAHAQYRGDSMSRQPAVSSWQRNSFRPVGDGSLLTETSSDSDSDSHGQHDVRLRCVQRFSHDRSSPQVSGAESHLQLSRSRAGVQQVEASAQTSPLANSRQLTPPGSTWALGGTTIKAFASTPGTSSRRSPSTCNVTALKTGDSSENISTLTKGVAAGAAPRASTTSSSYKTMLGPGTHVIRQKLPPLHCSSNSCTDATGMSAAGSPPGQQQVHANLCGVVSNPSSLSLQPVDAAEIDCGCDTPPALHQRLAAKQLRCTAAAAATTDGACNGIHSHSSSSGGSSAGGAAVSTAVAGVAPASAVAHTKSKAANKKKAGRSKLGKADGSAALGAKATVDSLCRRRDRDCLELALLDRGSSSRVDSEDEAASHPAKTVSSTSVTEKSGSASATLSKCKFKGCKLTFAAGLNQHRCHMSHLPSARTASAKAHQAYRTDVSAFFKALPPATVAKLLRLPEPMWLPKYTPARVQQQQKQPPGGAGKTAAGVDAAGVAAAEAAAKLQSQKLASSWRAQCASAASVADDASNTVLSPLAQLCCGVINQTPSTTQNTLANSDVDTDTDAEQQGQLLPLISPPSRIPLQPQQADDVADACGACCSVPTAASSSGHCRCCCHDFVQRLAEDLPPIDTILELLEQASEGTWLCNPRLLQQPHPASCCCSVCTGHRNGGTSGSQQGGAAASAAGHQGWSPEAVMASISSGLDVLDVLLMHGVTDAALSYAVERRVVTAFHQAKEAEARHIMSQLLDESNTGSQKSSAAAVATHGKSHGTGAAVTGSLAGQAAVAVTTKPGKKDKKKSTKRSKGPGATANPAPHKVPAWKTTTSDSGGDSDDSSSTCSGSQGSLDVLVLASSHSSSSKRGAVPVVSVPAAGNNSAAMTASSKKQPVVATATATATDTSLQGRRAAEQLLQARLLQQDMELKQLQARKQQQLLHKPEAHQQETTGAATSKSHQPKEALQEGKPKHTAQQKQQQHAQQTPVSKHQKVKPAPPPQQQGKQHLTTMKTTAAPAPAGRQPKQHQHSQPADTSSIALNYYLPNKVNGMSGLQQPQSTAQELQPKQQIQRQHFLCQRHAQAAQLDSRSDAPQQVMPRCGVTEDATVETTCFTAGDAAQADLAAGKAAGTSVVLVGDAAADPLSPRSGIVPSPNALSITASSVSINQLGRSTQVGPPCEEGGLHPAPACVVHQDSSNDTSEPCATQPVAQLSAAAVAIHKVQPDCGLQTAVDKTLLQEAEQHMPEQQRQQQGAPQDSGSHDNLQQQQRVQQQQTLPACTDHQQRQATHAHLHKLPQQQVYYQQLECQQALLLQQVGQQAELMSWMRGAHSRAAQDMLVYTGRAAAAAEGQDVVPFTEVELQQVHMWTLFYYNSTLVTVAAMQQPQQGQPWLGTVPALAIPAASTAEATAAATADGDALCPTPAAAPVSCAAAAPAQPGQQVPDNEQVSAAAADHQHMLSSPAQPEQQQMQQRCELQFGTLPADLLLTGDIPQHSQHQHPQQQQQQQVQAAVQYCSSETYGVQAPQPAAAAAHPAHLQCRDLTSSQAHSHAPYEAWQQGGTAAGSAQQQQQFHVVEAAEMLEARWQAAVEVCGPPQPCLPANRQHCTTQQQQQQQPPVNGVSCLAAGAQAGTAPGQHRVTIAAGNDGASRGAPAGTSCGGAPAASAPRQQHGRQYRQQQHRSSNSSEAHQGSAGTAVWRARQ